MTFYCQSVVLSYHNTIIESNRSVSCSPSKSSIAYSSFHSGLHLNLRNKIIQDFRIAIACLVTLHNSDNTQTQKILPFNHQPVSYGRFVRPSNQPFILCENHHQTCVKTLENFVRGWYIPIQNFCWYLLYMHIIYVSNILSLQLYEFYFELLIWQSFQTELRTSSIFIQCENHLRISLYLSTC